MQQLKTIAITHKSVNLEQIGWFYIDDTQLAAKLQQFKEEMQLDELMYLSTCNRVEFTFVCDQQLSGSYLRKFFSTFKADLGEERVKWASQIADVYEGREAIQHLFSVASSIDSLVVGEREIITQVRKAYDTCNQMGITGDFIRLAVKQTIETAKEIYTHTQIAQKPVSVVSLAYRMLRDLNVKLDSRFVIIGSGVTNTHMAQYIKKHGFTNFTVFNRTLEKGELLAKELKGKALPLSEINNFKGGFDVLITCTGSDETIVTEDLYKKLLNGDTTKKVIVDLAIPNDIAKEIPAKYPTHYIQVKSLENLASNNLKEREKELEACRAIINRRIEEFNHLVTERQVELAMRAVPAKIREIKEVMMTNVFARELNELSPEHRDLFERMVSHMEKKMISVPMKMAREILLETSVK